MSEKCPLGDGLYWELGSDAFNGIPQICREQCGPIWEEVVNTTAPEEDHFPHDTESDCTYADVDYSDASLQRSTGSGGTNRSYGILNECTECGDEAFAEMYRFTCPSDEQAS